MKRRLFMQFWRSLVDFLQAEMTEPSSYGWFHFMWVAIIAAATTLICIKFKNCSDKTMRKITLIVAIVLIIFDVYKQITYDGNLCYNEELGRFTMDYSWSAFPFQLCSTPHYVLPFIIFLPEGKVRDAFIAFMIFFSIVGGLCVFAYPEDCLVSRIGVNIQTMLHHGMQITLAVFYAVHERRKLNVKYYLRAVPIFVCFMLIAFSLNLIVNEIFLAQGIEGAESFNMFYIGPIVDCSLPLLNMIYPLVPYPVFFCLYLFGFILCGYILYNVFSLSLKRWVKRETGVENNEGRANESVDE